MNSMRRKFYLIHIFFRICTSTDDHVIVVGPEQNKLSALDRETGIQTQFRDNRYLNHRIPYLVIFDISVSVAKYAK